MTAEKLTELKTLLRDLSRDRMGKLVEELHRYAMFRRVTAGDVRGWLLEWPLNKKPMAELARILPRIAARMK
jgi:hypothetical protein